MNKKDKVAVIGTGQFGTYICKYLAENKWKKVFAYDSNTDVVEALRKTRKHPIHFTDLDIELPKSINFTSSLEECVSDAEVVFAAVPAQLMRKAIKAVKKYFHDGIVLINVAKALELKTNKSRR